MIFDSLSLKQRVVLQVALNVGLQVYVVSAALLGLGAGPLVAGSLLIGVFMLWLYLDSASGTGRFVTTLMAGAERMGRGGPHGRCAAVRQPHHTRRPGHDARPARAPAQHHGHLARRR